MKVKSYSLLWIILIILVVVLFTCMSCKSKEGYPTSAPGYRPTSAPGKPKSCSDFVKIVANGISGQAFTPQLKNQISESIQNAIRNAYSSINPLDKKDYDNFLKQNNCGSFDSIGDNPQFNKIIKDNAKRFISNMF